MLEVQYTSTGPYRFRVRNAREIKSDIVIERISNIADGTILSSVLIPIEQAADIAEALLCLATKPKANPSAPPLDYKTVTINDFPFLLTRPNITHESICELANQPVTASVIYHYPIKKNSSTSGVTHVGKAIPVVDGMKITCVRTGNA